MSPPVLLPLMALLSAALWGAQLREGFQPFALLASLLPLQLAALLWCLRDGATGVERPVAARKPPASG